MDDNKFVDSEIEEGKIARLMLDGHDLNPVKLWHAPGVPTVFNAVCILAPRLGIVPVSQTVKATRKANGQRAYVAVVKARFNHNTRNGAAVSSDKDVATLLAYRNAIRQIITGDEG